jgi:NADH-quinone oxidoreductase subunit E
MFFKEEKMLDKSFYEKTDEILSNYSLEEKSLIPIAQDVQAAFTYIPPEILCYVASKIGISDARAYSVTSFYENFSYEAKGKYVIKVCDGTACHVKKSVPILNELMTQLGLGDGKVTSDDKLFTVETVSCLGACSLAPAVTVNDEVHPKMNPDKIVELIENLRKEQ